MVSDTQNVKNQQKNSLKAVQNSGLKISQKSNTRFERQKKKNGFRKYQIQDANNFKHYSKFRCMISQPAKYFGVQLLLQISMLYFYVLTFSNHNFIRIELSIAIICVHALVSVVFIALAFINPGIIPKIHKDYEIQSLKNIPFKYSEFAVNDDDQFILYSVPIKSHHINLKFCEQCLIFKPPRTIHCWTCNACIQKMDHHCPFIGNCVGKGNYSFFIIFVSGNLALTAMIIGQILFMIIKFSIAGNIQERVSFWFCIPLLLIAIVALCFVGSLLGFHTYLIQKSLTTNEYCKNSWDAMAGNPFSKNFCGNNIFKFITGPSNSKKMRPSTIVDFRHKNKSDNKASFSESDELDQSPQYKIQEQNQIQSEERLKHELNTCPTKSVENPSMRKDSNIKYRQKEQAFKNLNCTEKNLNTQNSQHL